MNTGKHQALALVFFGTTMEAGLKVYEHIEAFVACRYPDMQVCRAFTSRTVIRRLKDRGITVMNLGELLDSLKQQGVVQVTVMPFLIVPGQEYNKIRSVLAEETELQLVCTEPLLSSEADIDAVIDALAKEIPDNIPTVIACHGNGHYDCYNQEIQLFAQKIEALYPNVMVASIEGDLPGQAPLEKARELAEKAGSVHFIPLMLVAGDHLINDIMGDEPDSWKSLVAAETSSCSGPAGLDDRIIELYCQHLDAAIATFTGARP